MNFQHRQPTFHRAGLLAAATLTAFVPALRAETWIDTASGTANWQDTTKWLGGLVPNAAGATANITADLTAGKSINLNDDRTVGTLNIGDPTATYFAYNIFQGTGTPNALIFDNSGAGAALNISAAAAGIPGGGSTILPGVSISAPVLLNDNLTITNSTGTNGAASPTWNSLQFGFAITQTGGARSLTHAGTGTTALSTGNTYSGGTFINGGRVGATGADSFGTGAVTVASGGQMFAAQVTGIGNAISLTGNGFTETAGNLGALLLDRSSTTGSITVTGSTRIGSVASTTGGSATLGGALIGNSGAVLELNGPGSSGVINLNGNAAGFTGTVNVAAGGLVVGASSNLGGNLIVGRGASLSGESAIAGNLELGANSSTGAPPIVASTLTVNNATPGALAVSGNLTLTGTTNVKLTAIPTGVISVLTYGGSLSGTGSFDLEGGITNYRAGTAFNTGTGSNSAVTLTYVTGSVTWAGGVAGAWSNFGSGWAGGDTFRAFDNVLFDGASPGTVTVSGTINAGTVTVSGANDHTFEATAGNAIAIGSLVKNGSGTLTLGATTTNNRHTFAGGTTINDGRVRINVSGDSTLTYGPLGTGAITMNGGALSSVGTSARTLVNQVNVNGSVTLGNATDSGQLTLNGGVAITANSTINTASTVVIGSTTAPGLSSVAGATLGKNGAGILRIAGTSTFNGGLTVSAGKLEVTGALNGSGALTVAAGGTLGGGNTTGTTGTVGMATTIAGTHGPGLSPGIQTFTNGLAYTATATFAMEMTDEAIATRGSKFDAVNVTSGTFSITNGATLTLALGTGTGVNGVNFNDVFWDANRQWLLVDLGSGVSGDGGTGAFSVTTITGGEAVPGGPYNPSYGTFATTRIADVDGKNDVYLTWTVPEPSTALLLLGGVALGFRRRRG